MPAPTTSLATQRPDLAESLMEFDLAMDQAGYIGSRVFPVVDVQKQAGNFGKIPLEQLLQKGETQRAPGSGYGRGNWTFDEATYATKEHGWEEPVDDREAQMYSEYFQAEAISTARAYNMVLRNQEKRIADAVFNTTTWTGASLTTAITNEWDENHTTDATPIEDVKAAQFKVYDGSGLWPNALIITQKVFKNLRLLDDIKDAIASSGAGESQLQGRITVRQIAQAFDLDFVLVAGGSENTAIEGQIASISPLWDDEYAMVAKIATSADFREPCIGRTFHWSQDGSTVGGTVESYREEQSRSDIIRVRHDVDEVMLYAEAGHLLSNVTT